MKLNKFIKRAKEVPWVLGQRLTRKPIKSLSVISDLFIWRWSEDWDTYFELIDIAALFGDDKKHTVDIIFFDQNGNEFHRQFIDLNGLYRQKINIYDLLLNINNVPGDYGTFAVFHQHTPNEVTEMDSYIAERGYVSYRYKDLPLLTYVHGNMDAIDNTLTPLSGTSLLNRFYRLQYLMEMEKTYEIALINSSPSTKKVKFIIMGNDNKILFKKNAILGSKQVYLFPIMDLLEPSRLIIESKMVMARPVIFCFSAGAVDVFHG